MQLENEHYFWIGIGCFIAFFLGWYFYEVIKNAREMPENRFLIDGRSFYTEEAARRYYTKQVLRGRRGTMMSIYDWENDKLIERVRCSEYFKPTK